jgi:hypothetical protein
MTSIEEYRRLVDEGADFNDVRLAELREHMTREEVQSTVVWLKREADNALQTVAAMADWLLTLFGRWKDEIEAEWSINPPLPNGYDEVERLVGCWSRHLKAQARALADWDLDKACAERNRRVGDGPAKLHRN